MKLTRLKITGFKKIQEIELRLSDVNILVGANGSGKSSIIQALHLACCVMRQADRVESTKTSTVGVDQLDYLPTDEYKTLGNGANWGNQTGSASSSVSLFFDKSDGTEVEANCQLRSARNAGISITGTVPSDLTQTLRIKKRFFSAYIPGISGIPNKEERKSKKVILKACSFGDSNVILRNALLLLKETNPENITQIEGWITRIIGKPLSIVVNHNNDSDLYIRCELTVGETTKPIELAGTGYLQLIQIFCYILLFQPGAMLIDEPDTHLHPDVQERLVRVLAEIANELGTRIVLTTHSPFIVRGAPAGTNVCWLNDGKRESDDRALVETALGWGAFGKRMIIVSEDSRTELLRKIISQWPDLEQLIAFYPGHGYTNVPTPEQAMELSEALGGKYRILVHRDRDSLTDAEVAQIVARYQELGVDIWMPEESDVEAYFCSEEFLSGFLGCDAEIARTYVETILNKSTVPISEQFAKQRAAHNDELHKDGGSPRNDDVWAEFQERPLKGAKGKFVFKQLKNVVPSSRFDPAKILSSKLNGRVALDLESVIRGKLFPEIPPL